jgi:2'-5' RNA ligase
MRWDGPLCLAREKDDVAAVRAFVAIALSPQILEALDKTINRLRAGAGGQAGRWVRPEGIHLTLKFLGDVPEQRLPELYDAVACACRAAAPFSLSVAGLGYFGSASRPRVIWAGVDEPTGALAALQRAIEEELAHMGFQREARAFRPHLTLARIKEGADRAAMTDLTRRVAAEPYIDLGSMRVSQVHVIKSVLRPEGALYAPLSIAALGAAAQEA